MMPAKRKKFSNIRRRTPLPRLFSGISSSPVMLALIKVDQLGFSSTPRFLVPAIQQYPERFEIAWQQPNPDTFVLRFLPAK